MLHAEEAEAEHQKKGIAGEADEGGENFCAAGFAVDAVEHPVLRDVAVEEGVAFDLGIGVNEPEAEGGSGGESEREEPPVSASRKRHWEY